MSECQTCDDRGFIFEQVDQYHRKQVICPKCEGAPIRAKAMALVLSGEEIKMPVAQLQDDQLDIECAVWVEAPYDQQILLTMKKQLKE